MEHRHQSQSQSPAFDVIISGFTGKYVVKEALKFLNTPSSPLKTLALAGRNPTKLTQALNWAARPSTPPPVSILTADTSDPASIRHLCAQTKLILNCAGPFYRLGEPVVAACYETGCDYLDICGELEFIERMEANYHEKAMESGSLVIPSCGFGSIIAELGWMFNSRQWVAPSAPNQIEAYFSSESQKKIVSNFGSYEAFVSAVANEEKLQQLRHSRPKSPRPTIPGPFPAKGPIIEHQKEIGLWAIIYPPADTTLVAKTQSTLTENPKGIPGINESDEQIKIRETFWSTVKPAHFGMKICYKTLMGISRFIITGICVGLLGRIVIGRWILLKYPSYFSFGWFKKEGPSEDEVRSAAFKMWFVGHGFRDVNKISKPNMKPDMEIVTRVTGPEVGYLATSIILVQCALVLLSQRNNLPKGGVLSPGIVFGSTDLQQRLQHNGISFDFISKRSLPS